MSHLSFKQQHALFRAYAIECFLLRDKVKEAYLSRLESNAPAHAATTDSAASRLFEALSEANFVLEGIKDLRRQDRHYYHEHPEELPGIIERVIHLKYALENSYAAHLHDLGRTLHRLRQG